MKAGKPIEVYLFPDTDHGMVEFVDQRGRLANGDAHHRRLSAPARRLDPGTRSRHLRPGAEARRSINPPADRARRFLTAPASSSLYFRT